MTMDGSVKVQSSLPPSDPRYQDQDEEVWVVGRTLAEAIDRGRGLAKGRPFTLEQDPDVLDTWFSAGLYPFASMGWPHQVSNLHNARERRLKLPIDGRF